MVYSYVFKYSQGVALYFLSIWGEGDGNNLEINGANKDDFTIVFI